MAAGRQGRRNTDPVETEWPTRRGGDDTVDRSRRRMQRLLGITVGATLVTGLLLFAAGYGLLAVAVPLAGVALALAAAIVHDFRRFVARDGPGERRETDDD